MEYEISPALNFVRAGISKMVSRGDSREAISYAAGRWGNQSQPVQILRAAVGGVEVAGGEADWAASQFLELVRAKTIIGRLQGFRQVPGLTPVIKQAGGAVGYWVSEGVSVPLSKASFDYSTFSPLKVGALSVFPNELLRAENVTAERLIMRDLITALAEVSDRSFIDRFNAGSAGKTPASVTYDAPVYTSSGDIADDVDTAIGQFQGDLDNASWVIHPRLAAQIGLRSGISELGAKGGMLGGIPAVTSTAADFYDSDGGGLVLLDTSSIILLDENELDIKFSDSAMVEMDSAPTNSILDPTISAVEKVSLFTTDSTGALLVQSINWEVARDNSVIVIAGCDYPAGA